MAKKLDDLKDLRLKDETVFDCLTRSLSWLSHEEDNVLDDIKSIEQLIELLRVKSFYDVSLCDEIISLIEDKDEDPTEWNHFVNKYKLEWRTF